MLADFVRLGGAGNFNEEIAREFAEISGEAVDWLDDLGTDFGDRVPYFGVYQPLNVARNYSGKGGRSCVRRVAVRGTGKVFLHQRLHDAQHLRHRSCDQ